jgi:hypothetical protein
MFKVGDLFYAFTVFPQKSLGLRRPNYLGVDSHLLGPRFLHSLIGMMVPSRGSLADVRRIR